MYSFKTLKVIIFNNFFFTFQQFYAFLLDTKYFWIIQSTYVHSCNQFDFYNNSEAQ